MIELAGRSKYSSAYESPSGPKRPRPNQIVIGTPAGRQPTGALINAADDGIVVVHGAQWRAPAQVVVMSARVHRLSVDHSERHSALLEAARRSGAFDVRMVRLDAGDHLIDDEVLVERKTMGDFVASLVDGRLFPQTARLAHSGYRSLLLIEGPRPPAMPDVHPHAVEGAIVSLAAMWRLPVLHSSEPEQSLLILRLLADQVTRSHQPVLRRFDRKPKRHASKRLFALQGLPGVGPALASRLLDHFGSIERVVSADVSALAAVRGIGPRKAALIRDLVR